VDKLRETGGKLVARDPKNFSVLYTMAFMGRPAAGMKTTPAMLDATEKAAMTLVRDIRSLRPANLPDADWKKTATAAGAEAHITLGAIAQQRKDYERGEFEFKEAQKLNPKTGQVPYFLGTVLLAQKRPELYEEALFYFARAAVYDGSGALQPRGRQEVLAYLTKIYTTYHGGQAGLDQLLAFAKTHATPRPTTAASRSTPLPFSPKATTPSVSKRYVVERPNHVAMAVNRSGSGYVQRPFTVRNQTLVARTYYANHASYVRAYRPYTYQGLALYAYLPVHYYSPAFYTWVRAPWPAPVHYTWSWGWTNSAWYRYNSRYFKPDSAYSSPSRWLTDFLVANTLYAGYQEVTVTDTAVAASPSYDPGDGLTPAIKQEIADEVQRQLDLEKAQAENPPPAPASDTAPAEMAGDGPYLFIVSQSLEVTDSEGEACALTEGDVLQLNALPPEGGTAANVTVLARKDKDCRKGSLVSVSLEDLTEMHNRMHETIDQGLDEIRSQQGQGEMPQMPSAAASAPVEVSFASALPPPDPNVARELSERTLLAPATVSLGQTPAQVTAALGQPAKIADLGPKKVYVYSDMRVVFTEGKVSDVQF